MINIQIPLKSAISIFAPVSVSFQKTSLSLRPASMTIGTNANGHQATLAFVISPLHLSAGMTMETGRMSVMCESSQSLKHIDSRSIGSLDQFTIGEIGNY